MGCELMNVYDFDNTIYDGETAFDFFIMCMKKHPSLIKLLPLITVKLVKYKRCKIGIDEFELFVEKYAYRVIKIIGNMDDAVKAFWDKNMKKIKPYYLKQRKNDDLIVSATAGFLLSEFSKRMGGIEYISSEIDINTGKIKRLCFRKNKAEILKNEYPDIKIDEFFTDSMNDKPIIDMANKAYLVKGNRVVKIK